jgi:tRNA wybutosine-synthesizing protein 4
VKNKLLSKSSEVCVFPVKTCAEEIGSNSLVALQSSPRPLLIGSSIQYIGGKLLIMGGSAVCFSFGTYWNKGCFTLVCGSDRLTFGV